ncbi:MAG TPA: CBS domain-containing protein [Allosphingosinicella sp.]|jgi:CBS domain-containing protein
MTIGAILGGKGDEVVSVGCETIVRDAVARLADKRIGAMPVLREGEVVGIISERDIINCINTDGAAMLDWKVDRVMTTPPITVTREVSVLAALSMMTKRRIRHLPVLEGTSVIGIVSIGDLVKYRIDRIEQEAEAMRAYIQSA